MTRGTPLTEVIELTIRSASGEITRRSAKAAIDAAFDVFDAEGMVPEITIRQTYEDPT